MRFPVLVGSLLGALGIASAAVGSPTPAGRDLVAIRAGTVYGVAGSGMLDGGVTILVRGNTIEAVGKDVDVPADARVVDYGDSAVVCPGFVMAGTYSLGIAGERTAEPGVRALDAFDFHSKYASAISSGVTSFYVAPARGRLIAGTGAVVKSGGESPERRTLSRLAAVHGAIDRSARNTRGYWEPPIPATVDTGLGYAEPQLPRTTMGAIVALNELLAAAKSGDEDTPYGPYAPRDLAPLLESKTPWRITANSSGEVRAIVEWAKANGVPLVVDGAADAGSAAEAVAEAGAAVIYDPPFDPESRLVDRGKGEDARWPDYGVPAALAAAGAKVAIASSGSPNELLFAAQLAMGGGLAADEALRAITKNPAEILGVADRVGSIGAGMDADLVVMTGSPMAGTSSVVATWIDGSVAWKAHESAAVVLEVDELHLGDGHVLRPGQVLMKGGRIVEVAERVSHPRGATVVRGAAAMPGMIDAFGHLGLEGSSRVPNSDFSLATIVEPGDRADRKVAAAGVTTVVLTPRGSSSSGAPVMAYKPAADELEHQILSDPVALRLSWSSRNRIQSGDGVRALLAKGAAYRNDWIEYEQAIAEWTPPPAAPEKADEDEADEESDEDEGDADEKDDKKKKKKKKKKKEKEPLPPDPVSGVWEGELEGALRVQVGFEAGNGSGDVAGNLRGAGVTEGLIEIEGWWNHETETLALAGLGSGGWVSISAKIERGEPAEDDEDEKPVFLAKGTLSVGETEHELALTRTSDVFRVAGRTDKKPVEEERVKPPKGKPKMPKLDAKLEPIRRAMDGRGALVVEVDRADEIVDCVGTFNSYRIKPILYGADEAWKVADDIAGGVSGVLLSPRVIRRDSRKGTDVANRFAELQHAGIPVAFRSEAEEGAAELPLAAAWAVSQGMSPTGALRALTYDAAQMMRIHDRVGRIRRGLDADVLLLDGSPLEPGTSVLRAWVNGVEIDE